MDYSPTHRQAQQSQLLFLCKRVWTWAVSLIETTSQACDWNLIPGLLKLCLTLSKLKNSNKSLSIWLSAAVMARTRTFLSLAAPCTSISQCSSQARKDEAGIIPSAAKLSSALLQSGSWGKDTGAHCQLKTCCQDCCLHFIFFYYTELRKIYDQFLLACSDRLFNSH